MERYARCAVRENNNTVLAALLASVVLLSAMALVLAAPAQAHADSGVSGKQILKILKKYDKDGYYVVNTMNKRGDDYMQYWNGLTYFNGFDMMVHEECHGINETDWNYVRIYVGKKKAVTMPWTRFFRTKKIAKSVPKKLRSSRYWTYVAKPVQNQGSNVDGPYGLLDEFSAYSWGFNSLVKLYKLALNDSHDADMWHDYISGSANTAISYAEFRYFTEHYLYYAQKHDKATYRAVMRNKNYRKALKKIDKAFSANVKKYDKILKKIADKMESDGRTVELDTDDYLYISGQGAKVYLDDYNRFAAELSKSRYKAIEKKLGLSKVTERSPKVKRATYGDDDDDGDDDDADNDEAQPSEDPDEELGGQGFGFASVPAARLE